MKIKINGEEKFLDEQINLSFLIQKELDGKDTKGIAVAVNDTIIPKQKWESVIIDENDAVEIVHAVQGG